MFNFRCCKPIAISLFLLLPIMSGPTFKALLMCETIEKYMQSVEDDVYIRAPQWDPNT